MKNAGYFLLISAVLHVIGSVLSGFSGEGLFLLIPAVIYVALYAGLSRGLIWVAWLGFFAMIGGMAGALSAVFTFATVPDWVFWAILAADLAAAIGLFAAIWSGRRGAEA